MKSKEFKYQLLTLMSRLLHKFVKKLNLATLPLKSRGNTMGRYNMMNGVYELSQCEMIHK